MVTDHRQTLLGLNQDNELERLISDVMNHKVSQNALAESRELMKLGNALECLKDTLRSTSRMAKLWLRFMDYIEIIKDFICCERLGMWDVHLNAVNALLNLYNTYIIVGLHLGPTANCSVPMELMIYHSDLFYLWSMDTCFTSHIVMYLSSDGVLCVNYLACS